MPRTYEPIARTTLTTSGSVTLSSIPSGYTDLVLQISAQSASTSYLGIRFNGDSGSNYSRTGLQDAGGGYSFRQSNQTIAGINGVRQGADSFGNILIYINNYSNTTTNKTFLYEGHESNSVNEIGACLWRNTAAITSIYIDGPFNPGSTFTLYGIKAA